MSRHLIIGWGLLGLLAFGAHAAEIDARVEIDARGRLQLAGLPAILDDAEVQRHLSSGLTTSFLFRVRPPRPMEPGASRIDIRLELWDEIFLVSLIDGEGRLSEFQHESPEALKSWWADVGVVVSGPAATVGALESAKVSLDVVPFSQAELTDTQRWLAESMGQAGAGARPGEGGGVSRAVGALIATSMQRRSIRSWVWAAVPIERLEVP